ncbi:phosphoribosyltransferase [Candidatus Daviesbacteria bacterium]|nr:phosphoribosyltransferase [Candidatus Daviesbacteria bacterium]
MKLFKDRRSAGILLAKRLRGIRGLQGGVVLGIPRGGVVVAAEIAKELNLPLDIIVTRKIGAPNQPELALGAVDTDGEVVWETKLLKDLRFKIGDLREKIEEELIEVKRREQVYRVGRKPIKLIGKTVILADDGIATGSTTLAAVNYLKKHQVRTIILAVSVISKDTAEKIKEAVDIMVALNIPQNFRAVGQFYYQFESVSDEEVVQLLHHER